VYDNVDRTTLEPGVSLTIDAEMSAMGHGMNTVPTVTSNGDGTFRVDNMHFSMEGQWEIYVGVLSELGTETATFIVDCCEG